MVSPTRWLSGCALVVLAACSDSVAPGPSAPLPPPLITRVALATDSIGGSGEAGGPDATGATSLEVIATGSVLVDVEYWDQPNRALHVEALQSSESQTILLPELEAGHRYTYAVTAFNAAGQASSVVTGTFTAASVPADLARVHFGTTGTPTLPLTMLQLNLDFRGFVAVNAQGHPVWWWRTQGIPHGFVRRANGNFVFNDAGHGIVEVTPGRHLVHSLLAWTGSVENMHHDILATPANTVLFLSTETRTIADSTLTSDVIWEWNPETGETTKRWSVFDAFDPAKDIGARSSRGDWAHSNSLAYGDHGNVILSLNWLDQVVSIAPDFKSLEWRLGGRGSSFSLGAGASFQGQHTAQLLGNGHLLVFDNGRDRAAPDQYSRALELSIDPVTRVARQVWSFRTAPDTYSPYMGSARRLANGNTFVFFALPAHLYGASGPAGGYEARSDGSVAFQLSIDNTGKPGAVYRGEPLASIAGETVSIRPTGERR